MSENVSILKQSRLTVVVTLACVLLIPSLVDGQTTRSRKRSPNTANKQVQAANRRKAAPTTAASKASQPKVVAVVNGKEIPRKQLASQCLNRYGKDVLESLINKFLIAQECKRHNVTVMRQEIDEEITTIAKKFNISPDRWIELLQEERQITAAQYRRDIIWPTLALKKLVSDKLQVTDEEMQKAFETEYGPKVRVRMIAVSDVKKAKQLLQKVKANPKDFGTFAKNESEDVNSAAARGLIPPIRKHLGDPKIEKVAFSMKPGQISNVLPFANQFVILQCEEQIPATKISAEYAQVARDRLKDRLIDNQLRTQADALSKRLQDEAKIVNVLNNAELRKKYPGVAAVINGQKVSLANLAEECIARHGVDVLDAEINYTLLQQALNRAGKSVTKQQLYEEVDRVAKMYNMSRKEWLDAVKKEQKITISSYTRDAVWPSVALKTLVGKSVKVTEEDIRKGFEANFGPGVNVLAVVLGNQRTANKVWQDAKANPTAEFFGQLASQYSIEPVSRANMGEVPPVRKFSGQKVVEDEAFKLSAKDPVSGVVAVGVNRYIIMYYVGAMKPVVAEMDDDIRAELHREIREKKLRLEMVKEFDRLKQIAKIDNYLKGTTQSGRMKAQVSQPSKSSPALIRPASTGRKLQR